MSDAEDEFRRPDDTARDTRLASKIILASPQATALNSLDFRKASLSLEALAQGPGASKLLGLTINDSLGSDVDWHVLTDWSGWQTLQCFSLINTHASDVLDPALWELFDDAPDLHELRLNGTGSSTVVQRLAQHPSLCRRLDRIDLEHCNLTDEAIDELGQNPNLVGLIRLELRQNPQVTRDAIARLRSVSRLSKTTIMGP